MRLAKEAHRQIGYNLEQLGKLNPGLDQETIPLVFSTPDGFHYALQTVGVASFRGGDHAMVCSLIPVQPPDRGPNPPRESPDSD